MPVEILHTEPSLPTQLSKIGQQVFETIYLWHWRLSLKAVYKNLKNKQQFKGIVQNEFMELFNKIELLKNTQNGKNTIKKSILL